MPRGPGVGGHNRWSVATVFQDPGVDGSGYEMYRDSPTLEIWGTGFYAGLDPILEFDPPLDSGAVQALGVYEVADQVSSLGIVIPYCFRGLQQAFPTPPVSGVVWVCRLHFSSYLASVPGDVAAADSPNDGNRCGTV